MAKETLTVKNFGPIREAHLDLRKVTVLIGEQASGKSVLAKLVAICQDYKTPLLCSKYIDKMMEKPNTTFLDFLEYYGLKGFESKNSEILFLNSDYVVNWGINNLEVQIKDAKLTQVIEKIFDLTFSDVGIKRENVESKLEQLGLEMIKTVTIVEYVPAERIVVSVSDWSEENTHYIDNFSVKFQERMTHKIQFPLLIKDTNFTLSEKHNEREVHIKNDHINYFQSSTGVQSITPLQVIIETSKPAVKTIFIIEEPELNLYPTTQKKLVEYLVEKCTKGDNRLIITTHSPYILTALNNCIQARNTLREHPEHADEVAKLVRPESQIDFEDVMAYFVADGTAKPIMNNENRLIDANALDDVSNELSETFDRLLDLEMQPA